MVRVALIGAGSHCRGNHAPALSKYAADHPDRVELVAVCDLVREKAEAFAEQFGFKAVYTDHREMIEVEKPDGCVCVMPIPLILPLTTELMRMGMPLTVEKPPGGSLQEARELVAVSKETGTPHMVSVNRRFQPLIQKGKQWALSQGPLRFLRASMLRHNRREDVFMSGTGIHSLDALRELGGNIVDYEAHAQDGAPLWFHVVLKFESGALGSFDVLTTDGCVEERYELYGEGYRVDMVVESSPQPRLRCWKDNQLVVDECPPEDEPPFVRVGPYNEAHEFVMGLIEKRQMWPTLEEIFPSTELGYRLDPSKEGQETVDRRQNTGDRRQNTGDRRQNTGDRIQETEYRRQETGDRRQNTGDRRQNIGEGR